jgi:outer membrane protein, heavy metal efflux system
MKRINLSSLRPIALMVGAVLAQDAWTQTVQEPLTLKAVFEQGWARQPEARSIAQRRDAALATREAAKSWSVEPAAVTLQSVTGSPGSKQASREYEIGLAIPLWLPGERARKEALGEAEQQAVESRLATAQLRLAAAIREAWWNYQRNQGELDLAQDRLANAHKLAADVARRFKAGDLSKADQHQADSAAAQAQAVMLQALGLRDAASANLKGWLGNTGVAATFEAGGTEPLVDTANASNLPLTHPEVVDWLDQALVARRAAALAAVQNRGNPELTLATSRAVGQAGDAYQQTVTLGIRFPWGSKPRAQAKEATAQADALDAQARADIERSRLMADIEGASVRLKAAEAQLSVMGRYAELARETLTFYEKAFRLGEADLPTRLRVELEAAQADRQLARTRTDAAAALSSLRQALGLLPN